MLPSAGIPRTKVCRLLQVTPSGPFPARFQLPVGRWRTSAAGRTRCTATTTALWFPATEEEWRSSKPVEANTLDSTPMRQALRMKIHRRGVLARTSLASFPRVYNKRRGGACMKSLSCCRLAGARAASPDSVARRRRHGLDLFVN